jgi:hypothetical protein
MLASVGRLVRPYARKHAAPHVTTQRSTAADLPLAGPVDVSDLQMELYRSRRSGRPLALVGAPVRTADVQSIRRVLRATDRLWHDDREGYLLLPESDRDAAERLVVRLEQLGLVLTGAARIAVFPDDALTSESLLSVVAIESGAAAIPTPPAVDEGRWPSDMQPAASRAS